MPELFCPVSPRKASFGGVHHHKAHAVASDVIIEEVAAILEISTSQVNHRASFVQLGGHSLSANLLATACRRRGFKVSVESILTSKFISGIVESARAVKAPKLKLAAGSTLKVPSTPLSPLRSPRRAMHSPLRSSVHHMSSPVSPFEQSFNIVSSEQSGDAPLTEMQLSLIHGSTANPGSNVICFTQTYKTSDIPTVREAWRHVTSIEPIFRSSIDLAYKGRGRMVVSETHSFIWNEVVVRDRNTFEELVTKDPTDASLEPSFEVITLAPEGISTVIWRIHHAFIDGYSAKLVYKKFRAVLNGFSVESGTDFSSVARGLQALQKTTENIHRQFWQRQAAMGEAVGTLALNRPVDASPASAPSQRMASVEARFDIEKLTARARDANVSLATIYNAAWALALSAYTDSDAVVFGVVFSGRNLPLQGAEDTIGPLINTLPLRLFLNQEWSTDEYLRHVFERMVELSTVHSSCPEDGFTRDFSSALAMEFDISLDDDDKAVRPLGSSAFRVISDLPISVVMLPEDGTLRLDYQARSFSKYDMDLLMSAFCSGLSGLLQSTWSVSECLDSLVPNDVKRDVLCLGNAFSKETTPESVTDDLVTLFERAVRNNPTLSAVQKGDVSLTYAELDHQAGLLASKLAKLVNAGDIVCVHADRSINWIIAIYGILKAGAVYSPLDPALPPSIRNDNFQTADAKLFLTPAAKDKGFKPSSCNTCLSIEELLDEAADARPLPHRVRPNPVANAYVCFTSGSTGKPKGVVCHHEGLVAFERDVTVRLMATPGTKVSQLMSPAFDGSIHEIFSTLSYGATLVLAHSVDPFAHLALVNSAIMTPSVAKTLDPEDYPELRTLYLVGEPCPQYVNDMWSSVKNLYNMYGPTEGTGGATIQHMQPGKTVNIGPPKPSSRVYILDRDGRLSPPGVVGEIYLAGVQVARGYIGRPEETAKRFLNDPFIKGARMYRTGDRGVWNAAGEVECLGRNDRQIKLRGFRLDLNDLEVRVVEGVRGATLAAICQKQDYLIAMIQPASLDMNEVRSQLTQCLPAHAVPRDVALVDSFPKTNIGKLDYKAMIDLVKPVVAAAQATGKPLVTETEKTIAEVWRSSLGLADEITIYADSSFKTLGGNSILVSFFFF